MKILIYIFLIVQMNVFANTVSSRIVSSTPEDSTVNDFDGNVYHQVKIGTQTWLRENLNSIHYSDGTPITGAAVYNNSDSLAAIYGRLYNWNDAMKNSSAVSSQGACPCGWHIPGDKEWQTLENFLGGALVAGGKMKDTGTTHWNAPNSGATDSSTLTILAGGEYDAHYVPHVFQSLMMYAVFWTSTSISTSLARERYLSYDGTGSLIYDWYKEMKYSIRCVKDTITVGIIENPRNPIQPKTTELFQNYPNPFNPSTTIEFNLQKTCNVSLKVYNTLGKEVAVLVNEIKSAGRYSVPFYASDLTSGVYFYKLKTDDYVKIGKMLLLK
jgi:uncharacterized protein (TIGR02145 family)